MRTVRSLLIPLIVLSALLSSTGQIPPVQPARILLVNVLDQKGRSIRDLTKENFHVKVNGKAAEVLDSTYSIAPRRMVVLLDTSGSMASETYSAKWQIARETIATLLSQSPPEMQIAMLTFSSQVNDVIDFSRGRTGVDEWLKHGPSQRSDIKGGTAFFDATAAASKLMQPPREGDAIYAIIDGGDNHSILTERRVQKLLTDSGIRLFLFLFYEPLWLDLQQSGTVVDLMHETGGYAFGLTGNQALSADSLRNFIYKDDGVTRSKIAFTTQAPSTQINAFYQLALRIPVASKSSKVSLQMVDSEGKQIKDSVVTYARTLATQTN
jgi:VWA domain-containing protein